MNKRILQVPWKVKTCKEGCCTSIVPKKKIIYEQVNIKNRTIFEFEIDSVISSVFLDKELAEYIVELHNKNLKENNK